MKKILIISAVLCINILSGCHQKQIYVEPSTQTKTESSYSSEADSQENDIVGHWDGLGVISNDQLVDIDRGLIVLKISSDNTFQMWIKDDKSFGVWAEIDSSQLDNGDKAYNFISLDSEPFGQAIFSENGPFMDKNSNYRLFFSIGSDDNLVQVEFERE